MLAVVGCNSQKKPTEAELAQIEEQYDYRKAIQHYKMGINYLNADNVPQALEQLKRAVALDANNANYHHGLALAYSMSGQLDEAVVELKEAIAIDPNASESYNLLGTIYTDAGRYVEATAALKKVIQDKTYNAPQFPYFNLGICMERQGRLTEALAAYEQAVRLAPDFHRAYVKLGGLYKEKKDFKRMLFFYQKAEPGFGNDVDVLFHIGYALFKLKRFDESKRYLAQVSILFPPPNLDKPTQEMLRYIEKYQREARY